ncbi:type II toxin-antitoxin system RelE/ParE family toxin [Blastomonas fulva]|uniref:type II toxin-antitoxin system RelE/ParE family toxin n=1 Tax=Blastomonas fulva TaxID=1550728 RepID=UPI003F70E9E6
MRRWQLTPAARIDLAGIWNYTADNWGVAQAEQYIRQIESTLTAAAENSPLVRGLDDVWRIRAGNHLCIFRKLPDGKIEVIRVLHERMDIDRHL